jgi:hypothetical protein
MNFDETLDTLDHIAKGEFHAGLDAVLDDPDEYLAFRRLGRLAAVSIKAPFARSAPYDPSLSFNWAKSSRQWSVGWPLSEAASRHTGLSMTFSWHSQANGIGRYGALPSSTSS